MQGQILTILKKSRSVQHKRQSSTFQRKKWKHKIMYVHLKNSHGIIDLFMRELRSSESYRSGFISPLALYYAER